MGEDTVKDRLIRNEQILRDKNQAAGKGIRRYFRGHRDIKQAPIAFVCECSQLDCGEHVSMSIDTYQKLHKRKDRFTIFKGHDTPQVENIVGQYDDFDIVEKVEVEP